VHLQVQTALTLVRQDGVLALWKGWLPAVTRGILYGGEQQQQHQQQQKQQQQQQQQQLLKVRIQLWLLALQCLAADTGTTPTGRFKKHMPLAHGF
jgi:hypothetical protein